MISETEATCGAAATQTYVCNCGDIYTEEEGDALGHNTVGVTPEERKLGDCEYVLVYICQRCADEVIGETVYKHNHIASITTPATCQNDGVKTLTCACGDTKTEAIPKDATGHDWVKGEAQNGVRTDECAHCGATKNVTVYEGTNTGSTNASDLKDTEIELNDANISFDNGVIDTIGDQQVTVSADKLEGDDRSDLGLSSEQLEQVGDNPIYNFTVNNGTENISRFGENNWVTITLPYTLKDGEDVDSIAIWFINDNGELESIEATYHNGYVTFKTNHFSYYTVTRLTPAERCALYGHTYTTQHVDGNCLKDEYDLSVCVRCHDRKIENLIPGDGHDYVAEITEATCTENGSTVYTCADCGHSYTKKINAIGHAWAEVEAVEATCTADGYIKHECANCGEEKTEFTARLAHVYTDTVVDPTCTAGGYTIHECDNCEYSYIGEAVSALGHAYAPAAWDWADDHSSAKVTFICEHDDEHTFELEAEITAISENGACSDFVRITYTATVSYLDEVYTDVKTVEEGTPDHKFSADWTVDEDAHWHECVCGEKSDIAAHHYVNGFCDACGAEQLCDHTELHREYLDISEFGCCHGIIYYKTCDCGAVKVLDPNLSTLLCDMDEIDEEEVEDENGYLTEYITGACAKCGLVMYETYYEGKDGCMEYYGFEVALALNGETIIENVVYEERDPDHDEESYEIDITEFGGCGGKIIVSRCKDCGEITELEDVNVDCDINMSEPEVETVVDENGMEHNVMRVTCSECGFEVRVEDWDADPMECRDEYYLVVSVHCGEETIFEVVDTEIREDDDCYDFEYEFFGETCHDGIKITGVCNACGETIYAYTDSHVGMEYDVRLDLSEYTSCGGTLVVDRCEMCGTITYVRDMHFECDFGDALEELITDENGETIGYTYTYTCIECGLSYISGEWYEMIDSCEYKRHMIFELYVNGTCIVEHDEVWHQSNHNYEYTYELKGETCSEGYIVCQVCTICGRTDEYSTSGHRYEYREIYLDEYGLCGGYIQEQYCPVCDTVLGGYVNSWCSWTRVGTDEDGYFVDVCVDCGATRKSMTTYGEKDENCEYEYSYVTIYFMNGEEVCRSESTYWNTSHNYAYEYVMNGDSCTDGYTCITTCRDCGYSYENYYTYHNMHMLFDIRKLESSACGKDHYVELYACPCGLEFSANYWNIDYSDEKGGCYCKECGLGVLDTTDWMIDGCTKMETRTFVVTLGEEVLYSIQKENTYSCHSFDDVEVSVVDGEIVVTTSCATCGMIGDQTVQKLPTQYDEKEGCYYYDYSFTPDETGSYLIASVPNDYRWTNVSVILYDSEGMPIDVDWYSENGQFRMTVDLTAGETYVFHIYTYSNLEEFMITFSMIGDDALPCRHNNSQSFCVLPEGVTSCEEGVLNGHICTECGKLNSIGTVYEHVTVSERIDLSEYGACGGELYYESCACGENVYFNDKFYCKTEWSENTYVDDEGRTVRVTVQTCKQCGLRCEKSYYTVYDQGSCTETTYYTAVLTVGDTLIKDAQYVRSREVHDYEITATLMGSSCEDGVYISRVCKNCGDEYGYESNKHEPYVKERLDLSALGCVCGGYVKIYTCACGQYNRVSLDECLCEQYSEWCESWIENALTGNQYTIEGWVDASRYAYLYTCAVTDPTACAFKIRYTTYWLKDENTCVARQYKTWQFGYNEETGTCLYEVTFKTGSEQVYHNYENNSQGNTARYDCLDCGSYYTVTDYYDANGYHTKYERIVVDNVSSYAQYYETVYEYTNGNKTREYEKWIYADGREYWYETLYESEVYSGPFGDDGWKNKQTHSDSDGYGYVDEYAYVYYKGYSFTIYSYREELNGYLERYDYTYSFEDGCYVTETYTGSKGDWSNTYANCKSSYHTTIQAPTCTQDGIYCYACGICGKQTDVYTTSPTDHNWVYANDEWHYCSTCGLENANGASGQIILEDLTEAYGNGELYVVGYYAYNKVSFTQYVSLILANGEEVICPDITFVEIDGIRAFAFSKSEVEVWAAENGYTDYEIRFAFVPDGSDGSFDYAITFADAKVATDTIIGHVSFIDYVDKDSEKIYTITPAEDGTWVFTSYSNVGTFATLYDADGKELAYGSYGGSSYYYDFRIEYELKAGETYTISVRWDLAGYAGKMAILFGPAK